MSIIILDTKNLIETHYYKAILYVAVLYHQVHILECIRTVELRKPTIYTFLEEMTRHCIHKTESVYPNELTKRWNIKNI